LSGYHVNKIGMIWKIDLKTWCCYSIHWRET